ncbi:MAG: DUF2922 domain-containing protein [Terrisporobacter sp.]
MDEKKLVMNFKNTLGNSFSVVVYDPREDIEEQDIVDTMDLILQKQIFQPKGYELATCTGARIVESSTTEYDLEV